MLVLTRKYHEAVVVTSADGSECLIKVTVLDLGDGRVRLGFEADPTVPIHRSEVWDRIRAEPRPGRPAANPAAPVA